MTSVLFLAGALAICGLPLFNGFISEFIIYFGLFQGLLSLPLYGSVFCTLGILSLALMGALALACFTKVYGVVFLGEQRSSLVCDKGPLPTEVSGIPEPAQGWREQLNEKTSPWMMAPMIVLAGLCLWIGLVPRFMVQMTFLSGECLARVNSGMIDIERVLAPLTMVIGVAFLFLALALTLIVVRHILLGTSVAVIRETWNCAFAQRSSRFQYTASSFARPIVDFIKEALLLRRQGGLAAGAFPEKIQVSSLVRDASEEGLFRPLFRYLTNLSKKIDERRVRYTQMYLMYIFLFLIFLLVWKLR